MITRDLLEAASQATLEVEGVSSMSGTLTDSFKNIPGLGKPVKGVKISEDDEELSVELFVNVYYHTKIPQLAWDIQGNVKRALESQYSGKIREINVHVQNVETKREGNEE